MMVGNGRGAPGTGFWLLALFALGGASGLSAASLYVPHRYECNSRAIGALYALPTRWDRPSVQIAETGLFPSKKLSILEAYHLSQEAENPDLAAWIKGLPQDFLGLERSERIQAVRAAFGCKLSDAEADTVVSVLSRQWDEAQRRPYAEKVAEELLERAIRPFDRSGRMDSGRPWRGVWNAQGELRPVRAKVQVKDLWFSQPTVSDHLTDHTPLADAIREYEQRGADSMKAINVVDFIEGAVVTVDNRRVAVAAMAKRMRDEPGKWLDAIVHHPDEPLPEAERRRFSLDGDWLVDGHLIHSGAEPSTWGEAVIHRALKNRARGYEKFPLTGTPLVPIVDAGGDHEPALREWLRRAQVSRRY